MHKSSFIVICLFISCKLIAQADLQRRLSIINNPLTRSQKFVRNLADACIIEHLGYYALREKKDAEENIKSRFKFKQNILDYLEPILRLFHTHPSCQERIAYIKEISA